MKMPNDFAIFILTHERANHQITYNTLMKANYTGKIYFIIDNEDSQVEVYQKKFGDNVIVFDKASLDGTFDIMDNFTGRNVVVYARNIVNDIAKKLGIHYYMVLDDDYYGFKYRIDDNYNYVTSTPDIRKHIIDYIYYMLEFFKHTNITSIAMIQGGDLIGGGGNDLVIDYTPKRKVMNTFIFATDRPYYFLGRINEDVNMYVELGRRGFLFLQIPFVSVQQPQTQQNSGGLTDFYLDSGTYMKSFYTVMLQPSSVSCGLMGNTDMRIHHKIRWAHTVPMIIREEYKKDHA